MNIENSADSAPEEPGDGDVRPEDPDDAEDERHGGDDVGGEGEDDQEQRPEDAHHLRRRPRAKGESDELQRTAKRADVPGLEKFVSSY